MECKTWWHLVCAELQQDSSNWLCHGCLTDTVKTSVNDESSDENDYDLDMTASISMVTTSQYSSTSKGKVEKCVCFLAFLLAVSTFAPNVALLFMLGAANMKIHQVQQI